MNKIEITSLNDERVSLFTRYNEAQLLHFFEPNGGIFIAETPMVISRALQAGCEPLSYFVEESMLTNPDFTTLVDDYNFDIDIYFAKLDVINKITGFNLNRGVLAVFKRPVSLSIDDIVKNASNVVVLEDVMNPTNIGAIFRSAAALGVDAILITKNASDPYYRRSARVSMGTVFQIPWAYADDTWIDALKKRGFCIVSMALEDDAISIDDAKLKHQEKLAIVLGTEATGIKRSTIDDSDYKVIIPMSNGVDSLNVAAASAVAIWELLKR